MTSFLGELQAGRLRFDLLHPFPVQDDADRAAGLAARTELGQLLAAQVDPDRLEADRALPDGLVSSLAAAGFLRMSTPVSAGGRGLSALNVYRLLETAGSHHTAVGIFLAWHNVLGIGAYQELLPQGRLAELVAAGLADGAVFGLGDSEPGGAADARRATVARPTGDGRGFLLSGEKLFVGNGSIADLLTITATVRDGHAERIDLFLVDTSDGGFSVIVEQELAGLAGSPIAAVRLDDVFVPAERVLTTDGGGWRASPQVRRLNAYARMATTVSQTIGPARACLGFARDFLRRRDDMNGRPLAGYEAVQRRLAAGVAEVFAVDSVVEWSLRPGGRRDGADRLPELTAAKNIGTLAGWRVIDETVSLLGGEGVETAASKRCRGAPPLPVERALRDARCMRVAGGVDFNVDQRAGWSGLFAPAYTAAAPAPVTVPSPPDSLLAALSPRNQNHVHALCEQLPALHARCGELAATHPAAELAERQEWHIAANRIVDELFTMAVVLARAARLASESPGVQQLAEVYCTSARARVAANWRILGDGVDTGHAAVSRAFLAGEFDTLLAAGA